MLMNRIKQVLQSSNITQFIIFTSSLLMSANVFAQTSILAIVANAFIFYTVLYISKRLNCPVLEHSKEQRINLKYPPAYLNQLIQCYRQLPNPFPGSIKNSIRHSRRHPNQCYFTQTFRAHWIGKRVFFIYK